MGEPVVSPAVHRVPAGVRLVSPALCAMVLLAVVLVALVTGCAGGQLPAPPSAPPPSSSATPTPTGSPVLPAGVTLAQLGLTNGPPQFSVPRGALTESVVDQANNVVLVLRTPTPAEVAAYLRQTLPDSGFTITDADPRDATVTFEGHGWAGSFTTGDGTSAILLRPR